MEELDGNVNMNNDLLTFDNNDILLPPGGFDYKLNFFWLESKIYNVYCAHLRDVYAQDYTDHSGAEIPIQFFTKHFKCLFHYDSH